MFCGQGLTTDLDVLHVNLNALERNASVLLKRKGHLINEVLGNRCDVRAILDDNVKLNVNAGLGGRDDYAATQTRSGKDLGNAVSCTGGSHSDDTIALHCSVTDNVSKHVIRDMQVTGDRRAHDAPFVYARLLSQTLNNRKTVAINPSKEYSVMSLLAITRPFNVMGIIHK